MTRRIMVEIEAGDGGSCGKCESVKDCQYQGGRDPMTPTFVLFVRLYIGHAWLGGGKVIIR
jgi:hypothetical protein